MSNDTEMHALFDENSDQTEENNALFFNRNVISSSLIGSFVIMVPYVVGAIVMAIGLGIFVPSLGFKALSNEEVETGSSSVGAALGMLFLGAGGIFFGFLIGAAGVFSFVKLVQTLSEALEREEYRKAAGLSVGGIATGLVLLFIGSILGFFDFKAFSTNSEETSLPSSTPSNSLTSSRSLSPSITPTPSRSISLTPSVTQTSSVSSTPSVTPTHSISATPSVSPSTLPQQPCVELETDQSLTLELTTSSGNGAVCIPAPGCQPTLSLGEKQCVQVLPKEYWNTDFVLDYNVLDSNSNYIGHITLQVFFNQGFQVTQVTDPRLEVTISPYVKGQPQILAVEYQEPTLEKNLSNDRPVLNRVLKKHEMTPKVIAKNFEQKTMNIALQGTALLTSVMAPVVAAVNHLLPSTETVAQLTSNSDSLISSVAKPALTKISWDAISYAGGGVLAVGGIALAGYIAHNYFTSKPKSDPQAEKSEKIAQLSMSV